MARSPWASEIAARAAAAELSPAAGELRLFVERPRRRREREDGGAGFEDPAAAGVLEEGLGGESVALPAWPGIKVAPQEEDRGHQECTRGGEHGPERRQ